LTVFKTQTAVITSVNMQDPHHHTPPPRYNLPAATCNSVQLHRGTIVMAAHPTLVIIVARGGTVPTCGGLKQAG
jgi:hypothetical protein